MKRLISLLTIALMLFGTCCAVTAYDESEYDYYEEEYIPSYEPFDYEIIIDNDLIIGDSGYLIEYWEYYRYTTVAEALGFTTTFNEETGMVESVKDDVTISFLPDGSYLSITENGELTIETDWVYEIANVEDRVYIDYSEIEYFFGDYTDRMFSINYDDYSLNIITPEMKKKLASEADKKLTYFNEILNAERTKNFTSEASGVVDISFSSDFFGVSGSGNAKMQVISAKEGEKSYVKISQTNKGLMNLLSLMNDEAVLPHTIEAFNDGKHTYYKGSETVSSMLDDEYYGFEYAYKNEASKVMDKWCYSENNSTSFITFIADDTTVGELIVNSAFETEDSDDAIEKIKMVTSLLSDENFKVSKANDTKTYKFKVDTKTLLNILSKSENLSDDLSDFENFNFELTLNEKISKKGSSSVLNGSISIENLPNPWNEDVLSGKISFDINGEAKFKEKTGFSFPNTSKAVNLTEFVQSVIDSDILYE